MKIGTILRSPLLHFFVLGGLVFGLYAVTAPLEARAPRDDVLHLSEAEMNRMADGFLAAWGRAPTEAESRGLVRDWAIEEVMVREALALGLDKGDAMIRNRLRAKMEFLAEAPAAAMTPDDATLEAYYSENAAAYARPAQVSFAQVLLPGDATAEEVAALRAELEQGADPAGLGQATMLPPRLEAMATPAVERVFGGGFGAAVAGLPVSGWSGPLSSGYGQHLVRLDAVEAAQLPPLERLRDKVIADWRSAEARKMRGAFTDELLSRYTLDLPGEEAAEQP
ncbi:peptidyl-prolyl cis-trans isomerase [Alloyangia pacifica]|uniref:PPIC-type PPIASE domain-containing protein n=1 Tax=Alloyangia pacifica TaxID=311180 RepID=A0A1I6QPX0_9RHOB|nr:peptidylprolyl isomerase [Alloyangia pacifica]SDF94936.1 PPIC-type PPIASE domain-containing protein [Alloyangia pacifica]SFS54521.1 PPIC-type PPIASE domain-containing protein [Alloyangia pacifica]